MGGLLEVSSEDVVGKHLAEGGEAGVRDLGGCAERLCRLCQVRAAHAQGLRGPDPLAQTSDLEPRQIQG